MQRSKRRVAVAMCVAAAALIAVPAATAGSGTFTYMMCANPDTGRGTAPADEVFPDGVSMSADHLNMTPLQSAQRCSGDVNGGRGMIIRPGGAYTLSQGQGATFRFGAPEAVRFVDAHLWRRTNTQNGLMSRVDRSSGNGLYEFPWSDTCENPLWGCTGHGTFDAFSEANRVYVSSAHQGMPNGFKWFLRCAAAFCSVSDAQGFSVYGAKIRLADDRAPAATLGVGGLASDAVLRGREQASFSARDDESGVYRSRMVVDGVAQPWAAVEGGASACRDVNPSNGDDYEFGRTRPCPTAANGVAELNTSALADGSHNVELLVEDAGGRDMRVMDRDVVVDNVPAPSSVVAPSVDGAARDGAVLSAVAGEWDAHGAGGPAVSVRWERCDGPDCSFVSDGPTLALDEDDVGARFRVVETAVNGEGSTDAASELTDVVVDTPAPSAVAAPSVAGSARRGNLLVASAASWDDHRADGDPAITRRWQRCSSDGTACADIAGAGGSTYELRDADLNRRVRVVETASNGEGSSESVSGVSARVTREDGTLPADNNGADDDGDGVVDEPGETAPGGGGVTGSGAGGVPVGSGSNSSTSTSTSTTTATSSSSRRSTIVSPNGAGASTQARLIVGWRESRGSAITVPYRGATVAVGRLVDASGAPITGAVVGVSAVASVRGARVVSRPDVKTDESGRFVYTAGRGVSSETIRFSYAAERGGRVVAIDELELRVRAAVRLSVGLRGTLVKYRGTVLSGPMPAKGKLVIVQGRVKGRAWQTFASRRARRGGRFSGRYRLKLRVPGRKLQFRVRVVAETGFPYLAADSRAVTKTVH